MSWKEIEQEITKHEFIWTGEVKPSTVEWLLKQQGPDHRHRLVGHMQDEREITQWEDDPISDIVSNFNDNITNYMSDNYRANINDSNLRLWNIWINRQKKYEFNPLHNHAGAFSFVIFCQIPYNLKDEDKLFELKQQYQCASRFAFLTSDGVGTPKQIALPVDKDCVGKMLLFDARMHHQVYPFYTSDDYRITVSGNMMFDN